MFKWSSRMETTNFSFLKQYEPLFFQLATTAEKAFSADPNTTLLKLRQLGEALAQDVACRIGLDVGERHPDERLGRGDEIAASRGQGEYHGGEPGRTAVVLSRRPEPGGLADDCG